MNNQRRKDIRREVANLERVLSELSDIKGELETLRDKEQEYYDNMPESSQNGDKGQAAQDAIGNLNSAIETLDAVFDDGDVIGNLEAACL